MKPGLPVPSTIIAPWTRKDSATEGVAVSSQPDSEISQATASRAAWMR